MQSCADASNDAVERVEDSRPGLLYTVVVIAALSPPLTGNSIHFATSVDTLLTPRTAVAPKQTRPSLAIV